MSQSIGTLPTISSDAVGRVQHVSSNGKVPSAVGHLSQKKKDSANIVRLKALKKMNANHRMKGNKKKASPYMSTPLR